MKQDTFSLGSERVKRTLNKGGLALGFNLIALFMMLALPVQAQNQLPQAQSGPPWILNAREMDISELARFVADATDKIMVIDPSVKGRVQVISNRMIETEEELYGLFLSILEIYGFTAVDNGKLVRVIPAKDARTAPVRVNPAASNENDSEMITEVIKLENISAAKLISVLRPFVPQQGHIVAYVPSNAIIIADSAANIKRLRLIIDNIDRSAQGSTEVIQLKYASAEEVVRMVEQLQKTPIAQDQAAAGKALVLVADKRTNSVLVSGDELERQEARELIERLDTSLEQSGNVRVVYLEYANAVDLAAVLNKVVSNVQQMSQQQDAVARPNQSAKATIEADEGTNAIIITADSDVMQSLMSVIEHLDVRRAQVLVEAIIVEIEDQDARALGLQWLFLDSDGGYGSSSANNGILSGTIGAAAGGSSNDEAAAALAANLAKTPGQIFGFGDKDDNLSFNVVLNALNKISDTNILSTPSLLTLDNQEASIVVGKNVPFITGSTTGTGTGSNLGNPYQTIQRESVGITLKVTPHINEGDSMVLEILQEVSSLSGDASEFSTSDVITNERKVETKVLVDNGQMIILGGLIQDDLKDSEQKVPLLGDIPLLGRLFKNNSVSVTKTHLLVFIRPTIIRDSKTLTGATAKKYQYIRDQQLRQIERGVDLLEDEKIPLLPEWEEELRKLQQSPEPEVKLNQESQGAATEGE